MKQKKALTILATITAAVFILKAFPMAGASTVPPGWIDTSYHTSTAVDVSSGDLDSLMHPWWHIQGNSATVGDVPVIDRNSKTFYYPPFLHLFMASFMLILPAGLATILSISLIYSLTAPATYLLTRSYEIDRKSSLLGAAFAATSIPLIHSQIMGFWSFAAAFILGITAFSFYRLHRKHGGRKLLAAYLLTATATVLTHWVFGAFIIGMPLLSTLLEEKTIDWKIPGLALATVLPHYVAFFATSKLSIYSTTTFDKFYTSITPIAIIGGLLISRGRNRTIDLFSAGSLAGMTAYYLGAPITFGGMIQFALPVLAGFYIADTRKRINGKELAKAFTILTTVFIAASMISQAAIGNNSGRVLTEDQFHGLLDARDKIPEEKIVAGPEVGAWITLASGENRIVNPYAEYNASKLDERFYVLSTARGARP
ncbi:hypothetical protein [Candidatus Nanohalovita haloferacivicina]|uniref:hypothetical protein n=1 Tax=Candidatus Nanohalovita haloferacivicina TaxID=2978046 RepID=UPI00325FCAB3